MVWKKKTLFIKKYYEVKRVTGMSDIFVYLGKYHDDVTLREFDQDISSRDVMCLFLFKDLTKDPSGYAKMGR